MTNTFSIYALHGTRRADRIGLVAILVLLFGGMLAAQTKPDFSGTWTFMSIVPAPKAAANGLPPSDQVVRHTAASIAVDTTAFGEVHTRTFTLSGAEDTNHSGATTLVTKSRWVGQQLVTEGKTSQVTS